MDVRRLLVLLLVGLGLLPVCAGATTYKLPVRATASFAVDYASYPDWAIRGASYDFYSSPSVLKVGYDSATHKMYDSAFYFDWSQLSVIPEGTPVTMTLHWAFVSPSGNNWGCISYLSTADAHNPEPYDFDWFDPEGGLTPSPNLAQPDQWCVSSYGSLAHGNFTMGYLLLGFGQSTLTEVAGINNGLGYEAPYMLVTTVPEPSAALALGLPLLCLCIAGCKKRRFGHLALVCLLAVTVSSAHAQGGADSEPGEVIEPSGMLSATTTITPPEAAGFVYLPTFPRLFWSYGCAPTAGAMMCGYYDNSGFPDMYKNVNGSDALFPTGNWPNDNGIFLKTYPDESTDPADMYPSRCVLSATEKGVLGRTENGHVDDYWYNSLPSRYGPFDNLQTLNDALHLTSVYDAYCGLYGGDLDPKVTPHADDCIADFMGSSIRYWRYNTGDGNATFNWTPYGSAVTWTPSYFPYPNNIEDKTSNSIDALFGLAQYIAQKPGYHSRTVTTVDKDGQPSSYDDVDLYYTKTIAYYGGVANGVQMQDVITEIDQGRPLIALLWKVSSGQWTTTGHAVAVFGYRKILNGQGQLSGLDLLAYDTWYQDSDGEHTSYSVMPFPSSTDANDPSVVSLTRKRRNQSGQIYYEYWKLYAFSFLRINNHQICPAPLGENDYPSGVYPHAFDIHFHGLTDCSRVHYTLDGTDPNPNSDSVTLTGGAGTLHVESDCTLKLRTYRDATAPDGYVASLVVPREYTVHPLKDVANGDPIATGALLATVGTGPLGSNICYVEDRERVCGIRVQTSSSVTQGDLVTVSGTLSTNSDGERVIASATVHSLGASATPITPLGMPNRTLGGADLNYNSTTGAGQQGITDGVGLNNIGLLLKTTGCVCSYSTSSFEITDGSPQPITVITPSGVDPPESGYVGVTGVCSRQSDGNGGYRPVLLIRSADDINDYGECECSAGGLQSSAPIGSRPEVPVIEATDMIAWALKQTDGTTVSVKACSVLDSAASGLTISDGWMANAATIHVQGNWAVNRWSTVDVTGVMTTLSGGVRAISPTQILVYTDPRGRRYEFPMPFWRDPSGQLREDWLYKEAASLRPM